MKIPKKNIDKVSIVLATNQSKTYIENTIKRAENLKNDPQKKDRLSRYLCRACFYIYNSRIGGAAITETECGICSKTMTFSSTAVNIICSECADTHKLCVQCGGKIHI